MADNSFFDDDDMPVDSTEQLFAAPNENAPIVGGNFGLPDVLADPMSFAPAIDTDIGLAQSDQTQMELDAARAAAAPTEPNMTPRAPMVGGRAPFAQSAENMMLGMNPLQAAAVARTTNEEGMLDPQTGIDYLQEMGTYFTGGVSSLVNTSVEAAYDTITQPDSKYVENWKDERNESKQQRYERQLRMPMRDQMEAQLLGSMGGLPARIARRFDAKADGGEALKGFAKRLISQGGLGAAEGAAMEAVLNGFDAEQLAIATGQGGAAGMGGQAVFGEGLPRLARWMAGGFSPAKANVGDILFHTGSEQAPMAPHQIPSIIDDLREGTRTKGDVPRSLMTVDIPGMAPGELAAQTADAIPQINFGRGAGPASLSAKAGGAPATSARRAVEEQRMLQNVSVRSDVAQVLGGPTGDITAYKHFLQTDKHLAAPRAAFDLTLNGARGNQAIDHERTLIPALEAKWKKEYGSIPTSTGGVHRDAWDQFVHDARPRHRSASGESRRNEAWDRSGERKDLGTLTLKELYANRVALSRRARPGNIGDEVIDRQKAQANRKLLGMVDEFILDQAGVLGPARKNMAAVMKQRDDFEYGETLAKQMASWSTDDTSKNVFEYLKDADDITKRSLRAGFISGYADRLYTTPMTTLRETFGSPTEGRHSNLWDERPVNEEILRAVIGNEETNKLKAVTSHWKPMDDGLDLIETELAKKERFPAAVGNATNKMDAYYLANMAANPASGISLASPTGQAAIARSIGSPGPQTAASLSNLLGATNENAANQLQSVYDNWMLPQVRSVGPQSAAMTADSKDPSTEAPGILDLGRQGYGAATNLLDELTQ